MNEKEILVYNKYDGSLCNYYIFVGLIMKNNRNVDSSLLLFTPKHLWIDVVFFDPQPHDPLGNA